jgi:hypothetical protein
VQVRLADDDRAGRTRAGQARGVGVGGRAVSASARLPAVVGTPSTSIRSLTASRMPVMSRVCASRVMNVDIGTL